LQKFQGKKRKATESDSSDYEDIRGAIRLLNNHKKKKLAKKENEEGTEVDGEEEEDKMEEEDDPLQPSTSSKSAPKTRSSARNNKKSVSFTKHNIFRIFNFLINSFLSQCRIYVFV
jgi:hypothetical protein